MNKIKSSIEKLKFFANKNANHISSGVFVLGFLLDAVSLPSVTSAWAYLTGLMYACIVGVLIFVNQYVKAKYFDIAISFFMGSLISFVFIYYLRGSDILTGWPVLLFILSIMIANEIISRKARLLFNLIIYSITVTFLFVFLMPVVFRSMNDYVFISSLFVSGLFLYFFTKALYYSSLSSQQMTFTLLDNQKYKYINKSILFFKRFKYKIYNYIIITPVFILVLYFTNIIPAVPLTLAEANVYIKAIKISASGLSSDYILENKCKRGMNPLKPCYFNYDDIANKKLSFYNEIQAPTSLTAKVTHKWESYNNLTKKWEQKASISYGIFGGRENGYRGYTTIANINRGLYRVTTIINDNRTLGSKKFEIR